MRGCLKPCAGRYPPWSATPVDNPGGQAEIWRIDGAQGRLWLKCHRHPRAYGQESAAYATWSQLMQPWLVQLVGQSDSLHALLLTDGADDVSQPQGPRIHEAAGEFRRQLWQVPSGPVDAMPLPQAISKRYSAWLRRAKLLLDPGLLSWVQKAAAPHLFEGATRHVCHRDFRPGNWRWRNDRLVVLDLGHAKNDCWLTDLVKLEAGSWRRHPQLRRAFFRGLGRPLTDIESKQLGQLVLLHGLQTAVWGRQHGDAGLAAEGRNLLMALQLKQLPGASQTLAFDDA